MSYYRVRSYRANSELVLAKNLEATWENLAYTMHPHPTLSEAIMEAAMDAYGSGVHQ